MCFLDMSLAVAAVLPSFAQLFSNHGARAIRDFLYTLARHNMLTPYILFGCPSHTPAYPPFTHNAYTD